MHKGTREPRREVVVRLNSGLGNQLFQLTQGMALAERFKARLSFDTTWFRLVSGIHPIKRKFRLAQFRVPLPEAFAGPKRLAVGIVAALHDKTGWGSLLLATLGRMQVIQEAPKSQQPDSGLSGILADRIYFNGYWQSSGPFLQVRDKLLPALSLRNSISPEAERLIAKATATNAGFIHVRRGDYIHFMGDAGTLPLDYYSRALSKIRECGKEVTNWMLFSDDQDWLRTNFDFVPNAEIIDYQSCCRDTEDLMIMKACSAGIIANSSYSWWGAALGDRPNRPIITPDRYWRNSDWPAADWALPNWTQVRAWI
ncbi:MAG: alpha-1,2-fucosyltransferase [Chthoniobacterales bacterium]|nr:alpha-1,2-fucosyltransferase [Chthoniobacterales bacterium]